MPVSQRTRKFVWKRDRGCCFYCNVPLTWETKTIDHVIPKSKGGTHRAWNVVLCCVECNQRKGDSNPSHEQLAVVLLWKAAHENRVHIGRSIAIAKNCNDQKEVEKLLELRNEINDVINSNQPIGYQEQSVYINNTLTR